MFNKQYVPTKCHSCGYWSIHEIAKTDKGANLLCTHCKNKEFMECTKRDFSKFAKEQKDEN